MAPIYRVGSAALLILAVFLIKRHLDHVQDDSRVQPFWQFTSSSPATAAHDEFVPENPSPEIASAKQADISSAAPGVNKDGNLNGPGAKPPVNPPAIPGTNRARPKAQPNAVSKGKGNRKTLDKKPTYQTTPIVIPNDRVIVMAKMSNEDTSWVGNELAEWRNYIYTVDNPFAARHTPINKGKESLAYLQYIVEHYHDLPSTIVFLHSHKDGWPQAWHTDTLSYSNVESVRNLQTDFVQKNGYANLRCQETPGCPDEIQPFHHRTGQPTELIYAQAFQQLFNTTNVPEVIAAPCCGQFAVSKNQVLQRPKSDYEWYYNWVLNTPLADDVSGRVMEYSWHMIFGKDPVYCPDMFQCYQDVYGSAYFW